MPEFAAERTWHPSEKLRYRADKTIELKLKIAIIPEFERWLLSWGDAVEVVKPLGLRDRVEATQAHRCQPLLKKIENRHQGSTPAYRIMCLASAGIWTGVEWGGSHVLFIG